MLRPPPQSRTTTGWTRSPCPFPATSPPQVAQWELRRGERYPQNTQTRMQLSGGRDGRGPKLLPAHHYVAFCLSLFCLLAEGFPDPRLNIVENWTERPCGMRLCVHVTVFGKNIYQWLHLSAPFHVFTHRKQNLHQRADRKREFLGFYWWTPQTL